MEAGADDLENAERSCPTGQGDGGTGNGQNAKAKKVKCFRCGIMGHVAKNCKAVVGVEQPGAVSASAREPQPEAASASAREPHQPTALLRCCQQER